MEAINIPADNVPEGLKQCEQILKRAKEIKKVEPVVAYWCCFSAAQKALKVQSRTKADTAFLMSILDVLEQMKAELADNDAVNSEAAGAAYVENFALKVFMGADNEDRSGATGKGTIRKFVVAGQFIEVLRCFENGMTEEMEQKLQYARWKAADGAKALREGRNPTSGPPIPDIEPSLPELPPSNDQEPAPIPPTTPIISPRPSPVQRPRPDLPGLDPAALDARTPRRNDSGTSGAWSTVATPGIPDDDQSEKRFDIPPLPTGLSDPNGTPTGGERKNVRFMGPDGAPLSPAQTHFTVDSYDAPAAPPPTVFDPTPPTTLKEPSSSSSRTLGGANSGIAGSSGASAGNPTASTRPRGDSRSSVQPNAKNTSSSDNSRPSPRLGPTGQPSVPPVQPQQGGLGLSSPPPSAPPYSSIYPLPSTSPLPRQVATPPVTAVPVKLGRKQVEQTQKHARWAISALEFDDYETARSELRKALALLGG